MMGVHYTSGGPPNPRCRRRRFAALYRGTISLCAVSLKSEARRVNRGAPELYRWAAVANALERNL